MRSTYVSTLRTTSFACIVALSTLLSAAHAMAQVQVLQVTVPFAFQSGSHRMPAGVYRLDLSSDHVLRLRGQDADSSDNLLVIPVVHLHAVATGKVIFHRYGSQYFLSELWQPGNPTGHSIIKGRKEKEAQLAMSTVPASSVELALNSPQK